MYDTETDTYSFKLSAPLSVCWQVTKKCNLYCLYCLSDSGPKAEYGLNTEQAIKLIDGLGKIGVNRLDFTGGDINELIKSYPNMNIIIAHMGRNVFEDLEFSKNIIDQFYNKNNVLFDTSTITKTEILKYGISKCGSNRILYGSDFPYEKSVDDSEDKFTRILYMLGLHDNQLENILYNNANDIKRYCKRR